MSKKAFKFLFHNLRYPILAADTAMIALWTVCNVYNDRLLGRIASDMITGGPVVQKLKIYIVLIIIWVAFEWIGDVLCDMNAEDVELTTREHYIARMYNCKPNILRKYNTGYISGLVDKLAYARVSVVHLLMEEMPLSVVYLLAVCGIMAHSYHWIYALVIFSVSVAAITFRILVNRQNLNNISALSSAEAENVQLFLDTGTNIGTIQKLSAMDFIRAKFNRSILKCRKAIVRFSKVNEIGFTGFKLITYIILPICAAIQMKHPETVNDTAGFYTFLVMIQLRILHMVRSFSTFAKYWAKYSSPFTKLENILLDENVRQGLSSETFETAELRDCDYSYEYEDTENGEVRKTVRIQIPHFEIRRGDIVCVSGESGQGKTTLLNLLAGEIETDRVYINGTQTPKRLRCVFVAQDTEILDMTVMDNLSLGNEDVTPQELYEMFDAVGLREWIDAQPEGLDTRLGERGVFVSTGQRQRLNLIRGLVSPYGEIYFFDEPTSNVDSATEDRMIELIGKKLRGKTAIIVTHKPKIMRICTRSYVFRNGVLSEEWPQIPDGPEDPIPEDADTVGKDRKR